MAFFRILMPALAALLLVSPPAAAGQSCFSIANQTGETVRVFSKVGSLTYKEIAPYSVDEFCCPASESLCFSKDDGTTKAKFVRVDPNGLDEWSGVTCRKIRISPGDAVSVAYAEDGVHIHCTFVDEAKLAPRFEDLDKNDDGRLDKKEARSLVLNQSDFEAMDQDHDDKVDQDEYNSFLRRINILKGVSF